MITINDDDSDENDDDHGAAGARCSDNSEVLVEEGYLHSLRVTSFIHKIRLHQYHQYHQLSIITILPISIHIDQYPKHHQLQPYHPVTIIIVTQLFHTRPIPKIIITLSSSSSSLDQSRPTAGKA